MVIWMTKKKSIKQYYTRHNILSENYKLYKNENKIIWKTDFFPVLLSKEMEAHTKYLRALVQGV